MMKKLLYLLILLVSLPAFGGSVKLSFSPGRGKRTVEVNDVFYIYVTVSDVDASLQKIPNVPGAKLMYFEQTGESRSFTQVNGRTTQSSSVTYTATLRAQKEGSYSYGPIAVGGAKSNVISFNIGKESPKNNSSQGQASSGQPDQSGKPKFIGKGDGNLFLKASVSSTSVYEQQAIVYTVKLYTTYDAIKFIGATDSPKFEGFLIETPNIGTPMLTLETYQGKTYASAVIARYIIFPQMTGKLKVTGNTYTVAVDQREYYHDPFFGSMSYSTPLQLNVTPNDLVVDVRPLPAPKPADFSGAVGNFSISSKLVSSEFKTNQAASIVYTVTGTGNIKYVQLPNLSTIYPPQIEVYSPKNTQDVKVGANDVSGSVSFDYSFMPLEEGNFSIPDIKFVYFNPTTGKYETSIAKGYSIQVGKGKESAASKRREAVKFDNKLLPVNPDNLKKDRNIYVYHFPYWLLYILPAVLLICALIGRAMYLKSHADMASFTSRNANRYAKSRLKKAAAAMKRGNADAFYTEILTALWGYLSDKLKMPTSELMRDNVRQVCLAHNIPDEAVDRFINVIDEAEFAKYSSNTSSADIQKVYEESIEVINNLNRLLKK